MRVAYVWLVGLVGCGGVEAQKMDAAVTIDTAAPIDVLHDGPAAPRCNPSSPFGAPTKVDEISPSTSSDEGAYLSPDELTVYFSSTRSGTLGGYDIFMATRASKDAAFSNITPVSGVNATGNQRFPMITGDALTLYALLGNGSPNYDIAVATRSSTSVAFSTLQAAATLNSNTNDENGTILPDHSAIYYSTDRNGDYELFRAPRSGGNFGTPLAVSGTMLDSSGIDAAPIVTPDELTLFFTSNRAGGAGDFDIWVATRTSVANGFGEPVNVQAVNTAGYEQPTWISGDGCVLYLMGGPVGNYDISVAKRGM